MKKYNRLNIVKRDTEKLNIPDITLHNNLDDSKVSLKDAIVENLTSQLLEQDCSLSTSRVYDWLLEDYRNCKSIEEFVILTEKNYSKSGELKYNDNFSFEEYEY